MRTIALLIGLMATLAGPALAHEKGAIYLASKAVGAGGELALRGDKLSKSTTFKLALRGTLATYDLGEVQTDTAGRFQARLTLPAAVKAGSYTVVALAPDGDVSARADLMVTAAAAADAMAGMGHAGMNMPAGASGPHATAEMMEVAVPTGTLEWAAIVAIIGLSAGAGLMLLVGARKSASG